MDVHNNSAKASLEFVVVSDLEVFLGGLLNCESRLRASTTFRFDHNQVGDPDPIEHIRFSRNCRLAG